MSHLFAHGAAVMAGPPCTPASRPITITHRNTGATLTIETEAAVGSSEFEEVSNDGAVIPIRTRDYIVDTADMVNADDERVLPARGWIVTEEDGSQYEAYAPTGRMPWRWADRANLRLRIHTRNH